MRATFGSHSPSTTALRWVVLTVGATNWMSSRSLSIRSRSTTRCGHLPTGPLAPRAVRLASNRSIASSRLTVAMVVSLRSAEVDPVGTILRDEDVTRTTPGVGVDALGAPPEHQVVGVPVVGRDLAAVQSADHV